jgi:hypothetical protein
MKISFIIGLVNVECHIISKNIFVTTFFTTIMCLHPVITNYSTLGYIICIFILHILPWVFLYYFMLFYFGLFKII